MNGFEEPHIALLIDDGFNSLVAGPATMLVTSNCSAIRGSG